MTQYGLTKRQLDTLNFIAGFIQERGYSPSYEDIAAGIGVTSKSVIHRLVHCLVERGLIHKPDAKRARAITLVEPALIQLPPLEAGVHP